MVAGNDFVEFLGSDISVKILLCLDDPSDLRHASAVSTSWRRLVIENSLCKLLCLQMVPQLLDVCSARADDALTLEHFLYTSLARSLTASERKRLVLDYVSASSTDHSYEGIENTLLPGDKVNGLSSYWSSVGESDPNVPETLVYKLVSDLCVIDEILVQPHEGIDEEEFGCPIYAAKAVRFRFGHSDFSSSNSEGQPDKFVWTYTSPELPMIQRNGIQRFRLPEPVLCVGGILQVELLGRIIKHPLDGMYYLCVSYVQALGRNLSPEFDVDIIEDSGRRVLKHNP